jgi:hypothetical protein
MNPMWMGTLSGGVLLVGLAPLFLPSPGMAAGLAMGLGLLAALLAVAWRSTGSRWPRGRTSPGGRTAAGPVGGADVRCEPGSGSGQGQGDGLGPAEAKGHGATAPASRSSAAESTVRSPIPRWMP